MLRRWAQIRNARLAQIILCQSAALSVLICAVASAMPTNGAILPHKGKWELGTETNFLFEKEMKRPKGEAESRQYFSTLSFAPVSWFSLDFRLGCGNVKFTPKDEDAINYNTAFAGSYGFRLKIIDSKRADTLLGIDVISGFQHISVHPDPRTVNGIKNEICLDDWQGSLICTRGFNRVYPYAAIKYSKVVLTRITSPLNNRKRAGSIDRVGLALGADFLLTDNITAKVEGRFFDEKGMNVGLTWRF